MSKSATKSQILLTDAPLTPDHIQDKDLVLSPDKQESLAVSPAAPAALTPMQHMLQVAAQSGNVEMVKQLMDLKDREDATNARKAFVEAMAAFKAEGIKVVKDLENTQYSKGDKKAMYTSLGRLVAIVTPFLSKHGLSARWDVDQTSGIKVTCIITHVQGHSESVAMVAPPDKSGNKNAIQEIKSTITYCKACTFESICGLASTDANLDTDGNAPIDDEIRDLIEIMQGAKSYKELQGAFKEAFNVASSKHSKDALYLVEKTRKECNAKLVADGVQP